jgi:peptide/nickel transport system permease protein
VLSQIGISVPEFWMAIRFVRSSVLEALGADHVRTAQAKGLPARQVFTWHVLRNALLPLVTVTGVQLAYLLSGVVVLLINLVVDVLYTAIDPRIRR